MTPCEEL